MIRPLLISSIIVVFFSCSASLVSKKVVKNDMEMLYGPVSVAQLYFDYPQWHTNERQYVPDAALVKQLSALKEAVTVKIFLATWCPDSRREVPRFFKIIQSADLTDKLKTELFAVDRQLKLSSGLTEKYGIERVPTFIFFKNDKEIGRIVETPQTPLLEQDVLAILKGASR